MLPYLDIPFQHGSPSVLKRMKRPAHAENTLDRIHAWRRVCPDLVVRSTFIVGFPGETEAEFEELLAWLRRSAARSRGRFKYSPVEGATSNASRRMCRPKSRMSGRALHGAPREISAERLAARLAGACACWWTPATAPAIARSAGDAPEIDGVVRRPHREPRVKLKSGDLADVEITASGDTIWKRKSLPSRPAGDSPRYSTVTLFARLRG